jgi:hypothetical protein
VQSLKPSTLRPGGELENGTDPPQKTDQAPMSAVAVAGRASDDRMRGRRALLDPADLQDSMVEVDLLPAQIDQLAHLRSRAKRGVSKRGPGVNCKSWACIL